MAPGTRDQSPADPPLGATFPILPFLRHEWDISPGLFDTFLAWLASDREEAGRKYEDTRHRLIKIFASRGCFCPEDLADETINRVIVKVPEISKNYHGEPGRYFGGVARNVFHEYVRKRVISPPQPTPDPPAAREQELDCLEECLGEVPEANRNIILSYYEGEKRTRIQRRNTMARELGTEPNALRIRVHRIRAMLQQCVGDCLARNPT
jgi:DNA-directed RNA polymerase specialized sigma24 family protein